MQWLKKIVKPASVVLLAGALLLFIALQNPSFVYAVLGNTRTHTAEPPASTAEQTETAPPSVTPDAAPTPETTAAPAATAATIPSAGSEGDNEGYTPWDALKPELQKELKDLYSPEDLDLLFKPRRWVYMPDVVGMSAGEAAATLRNIGIVPRVIYEDSGNPAISEGTCFEQEGEPGMKWNTDASIFIWVQKSTSGTGTQQPANEATIEPSPTAPAEETTAAPAETSAATNPTEPPAPTDPAVEPPASTEPADSPTAPPQETQESI